VQEKDSIRRLHLIRNQPAGSPGTLSVPSVYASDVDRAVRCHQPFKVGEPVEGQYGASIIARNPTVSKKDYGKARFYSAATVFEVNSNGTLHLHYSDGSSENHVYPMFVRPATEHARAVLTAPKGSRTRRKAEEAYETFLNSLDTAHEKAQEVHQKAIEKKKVLMETVQKALDTKLAIALKFPAAQAAASKEVYARFAGQIQAADEAVAASQQAVTDTGLLCCDLQQMSETPGAPARLPLMDPLHGNNPETLLIVEPLD